MKNKLLLSLFPGIDLLGMGFEENGFCVVRSPDLITGGDIRNFTPPGSVFAGVFGGSPCQDFCALNRNPTGYGDEMLKEYCRIVTASQPKWFLFENVANFPTFKLEGYTQQRFDLDLSWFTEFSRNRHFIFGSLSGRLLDPIKGTRKSVLGGAVLGNDPRSFRACCDIQGLPSDFDIPFFSLSGKKQAIANGVPLPLSRYLAKLILRDYYREKVGFPDHQAKSLNRCLCGCGRIVYGRAKYHGPSCRKRAQRQREKSKT
ncbi:DNA cytosine methyltransferase [Desulfospira joergensenii]|uniref:DNA cytosine methyltransferase n=1 Tax=Desulfospira joergensenii TaxID=53329 RepID=UPI0003F64E3F|nr:DNA cytosine methyltransferase [Desulfospira joergensenii]